MTLAQLQDEYARCQRCPTLCTSRSQVVFGSGNPHADVLFVGEAPGAEEDKQGIPFCGSSGKVLQELLASIGLHRDDIFITNTILCRPENNRNPAKEEVNNCRDRLDRTILYINPKVIVTIGNFATERILGRKGITTLRGKVFPQIIHGVERKIIPVIHPANYLYNGRSPVLWEQMKKDFQVIRGIIDEQKKEGKNPSMHN
ncbi:uracil-DNA glycosylase [Candidatus Woesearchaeota archaeon]|nr:uracil-DNA glycosylase [Candidatus Woesearchaeota archaeon]